MKTALGSQTKRKAKICLSSVLIPLSPSRLLSAPCRLTRELHRGRVGPGARGLQLWPAGLWRRFHRLQAGHPGAETAGHGAGADRGRRADGKLVRGAAEEGGVQSSAPHCMGQGRGFRWVVSGQKPGKGGRRARRLLRWRGPSPSKARGNTQQVGGRLIT